MNIRLAACLVLVLGLVGWLLYSLAGGREGAGRNGGVHGPTPAQAPADVRAAEVELAPSAPAPAAPAPVAVEAERSAVASEIEGSLRNELAGLTGRVVESDGRPVAGMRVALFEFEGSLLFDGAALDEPAGSLELEETVTDAAGKFLLAGARQQAFHGLGLDLGGPRATVRVIDRALVHRERTDIGDVVLAPFGVLTGRVIDERGAPVAGARVRCAPLPAQILAAQPEEIRSDSVVAVNRGTLGGKGEAILEPPAWIREIFDRLPVPTTRSGADGAFRLEGVALAQVVGGVDLRGYVGVTFGPLDLTGGTHELGELVLKHGRTVRGVVEDSSGDAVVGAEVHAGAEIVPGIVAILQPCGVTDEEGKFELAGVAETGQIVAAARRTPQEAWSTTVSARHEGVLIEMESLVSLTVNVRDEVGAPLAGADLRLAPGSDTDTSMGFDVLAFLPKPPSPRGTFAEFEPGRYRLAGLGAGRYGLTARMAGRAPGFLEVECRASENEVTLVCPQGRRIELSVIDAATREPIAGARASLLRTASTGFVKLAVQTTGADGRALLGPVASLPANSSSGPMPSQTMLLVEHPRHGDHSATIDPEIATLVVELHAGGALAGRVHWGGAVPTRLYMLTLEFRGAKDFLEIFHLPRFTVTDLAGEFRCTNLAPGTYGVSLTDRFLEQDPLGLMATKFEPPSLYHGEVEIKDGETTELVIDLTPTGRGVTARIAGRVRYEGHALAGAEVTVDGNEHVRVTSDASGRFETQPFAVAGKTSIQIEGDVPVGGGATRHLQLYQESVELAQDDVHQVDLDLYPLSVHARVVADASGEPVPDAKVSASLQNEGRRSSGEASSTNAQGEVELVVLQPGDYTLNASAEGFTHAFTTVKVGAEGHSEPALLRLVHAVACAGHVQCDGTTGGRFSYMYVQSAENGPNTSGTRLQAPDYDFSLDGLPPGKYIAHIILDGKRGQEVPFELGKEGDEHLVLVYTPRQE